MARKLKTALVDTKDSRKVIYSADSLPGVSNPGGIATDNFHVYWGNKALGTLEGSVVKGFELPTNAKEPDPESVRVLAKNVDKVYGVCFANGNLFFSEPKKALYAIDM